MSEKTITVDDAVRDALLTLTNRVEHEAGCATEADFSAACTCGLSNAINVVTDALATPQQEQARCGGAPGKPGIDGRLVSDDPTRSVLCKGCFDCQPKCQRCGGSRRLRLAPGFHPDHALACPDCQPDHPVVPEQVEEDSWGHKITISIYVEGELPENAAPLIAAQGAEAALFETYDPPIDFVGVSVSPVVERPHDQGAAPTEPSYGGET